MFKFIKGLTQSGLRRLLVASAALQAAKGQEVDVRLFNRGVHVWKVP